VLVQCVWKHELHKMCWYNVYGSMSSYRLHRTAGLQDYTDNIDYTGLQYIDYTRLQYIG